MLQNLKNKNDELLTKYQNENNDEKKFVHNLIKTLLSDENCFFKMNMEEAYQILKDLEYTIEESHDIYIELINENNFLKYKNSPDYIE